MSDVFKDTPVKSVWRRWMCACGGEFRFSEQLQERYQTIYVHHCSECHRREETDESYPKIAYIEVVDGE